MKTWFLFPLSLFVLATPGAFATWDGSSAYQRSCSGDASEESQRTCRQNLHRNRHDLAALLKVGGTLERQGNFSAAVALYESGLAAHPNNEKLLRRYTLAKSNLDEAELFTNQKKETTGVFLNDGRDYELECKSKKTQSAINACQIVLKENPLRADVYELLGDAYRSTGNPKQALWAYTKAIDIDKNNFKLSLKRAALMTITGIANDNALSELVVNPNTVTAIDSIGESPTLNQDDLIANTESAKTIVIGNTDEVTTPRATYTQSSETLENIGTNLIAITDKYAKSGLSSIDEDLITKMKTLATLHTNGLISSNEFNNRKQALLNTVVDMKRATPAVLSNSIVNATNQSYVKSEPIDFGSFYALVIGNNKYEHLPSLASAVTDAEAIAAMLEDNYGFSVKTLTNANRYEILYELSTLRTALSEHDNLLIYYAGHGFLDEATDRGYWLPVDAEEGNFANWISTADVTDTLSGTVAMHAMVIADSCYSGSLLRTVNTVGYTKQDDRTGFIARLVSKRSRTVLTSGSLEPVLDSGGGKHSIFAKALLTALEENDAYLEANRLFTQLRQKVVLDADQTPQYANIRKAGHEGGDFVFVRRN